MSLNGEKVVIDIVANDNASKVFSQLANNIKKSLNNSGINKPININDKTLGIPTPSQAFGRLNDLQRKSKEIIANQNKINSLPLFPKSGDLSNLSLTPSSTTSASNLNKTADITDSTRPTNRFVGSNEFKDFTENPSSVKNASSIKSFSLNMGGLNTNALKVNDSLKSINKTMSGVNNTTKNFTRNAGNVTSSLSNGFKNASLEVQKTALANDRMSMSLLSMSNNGVSSMTSYGASLSRTQQIGNNMFNKTIDGINSCAYGFQQLSRMVTGIFGSMGLSGMVETAWKQATQRQTNMIYLTRRRGVQQARDMYNEIMNIVMELPGDDTFLTTILNQASARDLSMSVQNVKELGDAVSDYYIAAQSKGQLNFETQRELTSYILTGQTRMFTNSVLADEINLLKNKNTVHERSLALQQALQKTGYEGMGHYESAQNELEQTKGHFQKAFADLGEAITLVVQPILRVINDLDTLSGSKISQFLIATTFAVGGLFTALGLVGFILPFVRSGLQSVSEAQVFFNTVVNGGNTVNTMTNMLSGYINTLLGTSNALGISAMANASAKGIETESALGLAVGLSAENTAKLNAITSTGLMTAQEVSATATKNGMTMSTYLSNIQLDASTLAKVSDMVATIGLTDAEVQEMLATEGSTLAKMLETYEENASTVSKYANATATTWQTITQSISNKIIAMATPLLMAYTNEEIADITAKGLLSTITSILNAKNLQAIAISIRKAITKRIEALASWNNAQAEQVNTLATLKNTYENLVNAGSIAYKTTAKYLGTIASYVHALATDNETRAEVLDTMSKIANTIATLGLAGALAILNSTMLPIILTIGVIVGAIYLLIKGFELLGQAFGWWDSISGMFQAISDGINRIWNAFMNSAPIRGILQYFGDFFATIRDFITGIGKILGNIFNFGDTGSFDIVQSIINLFGKLGDIVMWVWNLLDDWSNSPLGIITWLNPLGILIFHLDEIGSLIEDVMDAWNSFAQSSEFQALSDSFNEVFTAIKEPFDEIGQVFGELMDAFGEIFGGDDPVGNGTEERINFIVEAFKVLATIIRVTIIPPLQFIALVIKTILTPIRVIISVVTYIVRLIGSVGTVTGNVISNIIGFIGYLLNPIQFVLDLATGIWNVIMSIGEAIKSIPILGDLLGGNEQDKDKNINEQRNKILETSRQAVQNSNIDPVKKQAMLDALNKENLTSTNVNNVKNMGQTYNNQNNQRQVIINQNFSEGAMPIDARNMTKKEAKKMFIGAFGYKKAMGSRGILR